MKIPKKSLSNEQKELLFVLKEKAKELSKKYGGDSSKVSVSFNVEIKRKASSMSAKKVKALIHEFETARTGIESLNDATVSVKNVRVNKKTAKADVIYAYSEDKVTRVNNVLFPMDVLEEFHKTRVLPI